MPSWIVSYVGLGEGLLSRRLAVAVERGVGELVLWFSFCGVSLVSFSLSYGIIRAPPPYRMVNAGLCDYKKKKKKDWTSSATI